MTGTSTTERMVYRHPRLHIFPPITALSVVLVVWHTDHTGFLIYVIVIHATSFRAGSKRRILSNSIPGLTSADGRVPASADQMIN